MGVCALGLASFSLVLSIVPGLSLVAGAYQKDFATVTHQQCLVLPLPQG